MKTKKFNKKLSFSKSTVADLNSKDLNNALGGVTGVTYCLMVSCEPAYCPTRANTCKVTCDDMTCFHYGTNCPF